MGNVFFLKARRLQQLCLVRFNSILSFSTTDSLKSLSVLSARAWGAAVRSPADLSNESVRFTAGPKQSFMTPQFDLITGNQQIDSTCHIQLHLGILSYLHFHSDLHSCPWSSYIVSYSPHYCSSWFVCGVTPSCPSVGRVSKRKVDNKRIGKFWNAAKSNSTGKLT
jgi:hypothetical protein